MQTFTLCEGWRANTSSHWRVGHRNSSRSLRYPLLLLPQNLFHFSSAFQTATLKLLTFESFDIHASISARRCFHWHHSMAHRSSSAPLARWHSSTHTQRGCGQSGTIVQQITSVFRLTDDLVSRRHPLDVSNHMSYPYAERLKFASPTLLNSSLKLFCVAP